VRDCGGQYLQIIDETPKGRVSPPTTTGLAAADEIGKRTQTGVPLVYHHHMNSTARNRRKSGVLDAAIHAPTLLFDVAHYQQGARSRRRFRVSD